MPKSDNQKARLFAVYQILQKYTDENHGLSIQEILTHLEKDYDIHSTRQTITSDFALLEYPLNIELDSTFSTPQKHSLYSRILEHEDIIAITESLQLNPFLSSSEKKRIVKEIKENICSVHEAKDISISTAVNEKTHAAVPDAEISKRILLLNRYTEEQQQIRFNYPIFELDDTKVDLPKSYRSQIKDYQQFRSSIKISLNGTHLNRLYLTHTVLPLFTCCRNKKWYLCAKNTSPLFPPTNILFSNQFPRDFIFYELAKISKIRTLSYVKKESALTVPEIQEIISSQKDMPQYKYFFEAVMMDFDKELLSFVYDRFGKDVNIIKETESKVRIVTDVEISPEFFSWIFTFGTGAKIIQPQYIVRHMRKWLKAVSDLYAPIRKK